MKNALVISFLIILAGCGNHYSVKIPYSMPAGGDAIETKKALSSLYITVKAPPPPEEDGFGGMVGGLLGGPAAEFSAYTLAGKISALFSRPGAKVLAFRVFRSGEAGDPYIKYFSPTGVLEVRLSQLSLSAKKEERSTVYYDKQRQKQTSKSSVWAYKARVDAKIRLYSAADGSTLDEFKQAFGWAEDRSDNKKDPAEWYRENENRIMGSAVSALSDRYVGRRVLRSRPLFKKKQDKESEKAVTLAGRGKWDEAQVIWSRRMREKNDWRDMMGMGVSAEVRADYPAAKAHYLKAREASSGDGEAKPVRWAEILGDMDIMLSPAPAPVQAGDDWFAPEVAVMPFTDQTTSIDGPPMLRSMIEEALRTAGYRVQPAEETDRILLSHGLTQGGQLGAADRAEICKWLGVDRLFYGDINEFGEVMAGIYNRRMIKGQSMLWDKETGDVVWGGYASVIKVSKEKSFLGGMFSQLAKGVIERMKNKPLAYEGAIFTEKTVESLPNKVR